MRAIEVLRSAESLKPLADLGMRNPIKLDEIGRICESAVRQVCAQHPLHEQYIESSRANRARIASELSGPVYDLAVAGNLPAELAA